MKKKTVMQMLSLLLALLLCTGCQASDPNGATQATGTSAPLVSEQSGENTSHRRLLNGIALSEYTIIYDAEDVDYSQRAAAYIQSEIRSRTGIELPVKEDDEGSFAYEIVVGETSRQISKDLNADTHKTQFAVFADENRIALEGKYFVIAAAAYFFVQTYISNRDFNSTVPNQVCIHEPIQQKANNCIFLIGDGMGLYQTLLFDVMDAPTEGLRAYSDGEDIFYGYLFSSMGFARTDSLSGVTDSAAAGTALATGYKTNNGYVGKDASLKNVQSLTELAASLGKATAVMSTEVATGATPASFSAHAPHRNDSDVIIASQELLQQNSGTVIRCGYDYYDTQNMPRLENAVTETLDALSQNEKGFFMMYEEAYIDKHCHSTNLTKAFYAMVRFNQTIGLCMEYAFYHPDTFVLITADHETGGLHPNGTGTYAYIDGNHTGHYVPVFAYGQGAELFDGIVMENTQIPKTLASFFGVENFGANDGLKSLTVG